MKTYDGVNVKVGSVVFVIGSTGVKSAKVLPPVTSYEYFGPVPVSDSFSTKKAAEEYRKNRK